MYLFEEFLSLDDLELEEIPFKVESISSAVLTGILYAIQLLLGMKNHKNDKKKLYKENKARESPKWRVTASTSAHYSGLLIGYMAWGFVICFHLLLVIFIIIRVLYLQTLHIVLALNFVVPVLVLYGLKWVIVHAIEKVLFSQNKTTKSKKDEPPCYNPVIYAIYVYVIFFAGKIRRL